MENNQEAADGTIYDNGYGICMIPQTQVTTSNWNASNTLYGAYMSSTMHTNNLPNIVNHLRNSVLGSHIVQRNVLLSSGVDSNYQSNAYTWTTAYATLMSAGQMTGTFAANRNKYDDGEANYKLPIFNTKDFKTGSDFWLRGVSSYTAYNCYAWTVSSVNNISGNNVTKSLGVRPLIYLR